VVRYKSCTIFTIKSNDECWIKSMEEFLKETPNKAALTLNSALKLDIEVRSI
jgi:hypothetical protein